MNRKMVLSTLGRILRIESLLLILPLVVALLYREWRGALSFGITILVCVVIGTLLQLLFRPKSTVIFAREGFSIVALAWIGLSALGALPFVISGEIPSFFDAFFETVSGFTTTGSSILRDVEALSHGMLFWRSFTHWVGGMGVLVFVMAFLPNLSDRSIHIMRAEVPGPIVGKLVPRVKDTAKILYLLYVILTAVEVVLLLCGGMNLFDSLVHSFGTAGTGGFAVKSDGLGGYSPYLQWVIAVFMMLFGVNFNLYYLIAVKKFSTAIRSSELRCYGAIVFAVTALISLNIRALYPTVEETVRHAFFQVSSIITTTGFATVDFNLWPDFSKGLLLVLMFVGGCAGSTAGGLKVSRVMILFKSIGGELHRLIHPRAVSTAKLEGKTLDDRTIWSANNYFALYMVCLLSIFALLSLEPFGFETNFSAAVSCFNNIGPGFASVGPMSSFADYSAGGKLLLSAAMLLGRLEIFPLLLAASPSTWRK